MKIEQGANAPVPSHPFQVSMRFDMRPAKLDVDVSAYLLTAKGKVRGDADMIFYNQTSDADRAVLLNVSGSHYYVDTSRLPEEVERIAFCVVVDGGAASELGAVTMAVAGGAEFRYDTTTQPLAAVIVGELYRRNGVWKMRAVGQGFAGGLEPLARSFGIDVQAETKPVATPKVDLRKQRIVSLQKTDPKLALLAGTAKVSLAKKGVDGMVAKVSLVVDISASMRERFRNGSVDRLVQRVLGLALQLDDDGSVDAFAFGSGAHHLGEETADTYATFTQRLMRRPGLEPNTYYGKVMQMVRAHYRAQPEFGHVPVYVMFITDGGTNDPRFTETQIVESASEGIFWQFMAIGELPRGLTRKRSTLPKGFDFLEMLDKMPGRLIDNANFFAVADPDEPTDAELYDLMMEEYPSWLKLARQAKVLS